MSKLTFVLALILSLAQAWAIVPAHVPSCSERIVPSRPVLYTNLMLGSSPFMLLSAYGQAFSPRDVGRQIIITGGPGFVPGTYTITRLTWGLVILDRGAGFIRVPVQQVRRMDACGGGF